MPYHLGTGATTLAEGHSVRIHMLYWRPYSLGRYRQPVKPCSSCGTVQGEGNRDYCCASQLLPHVIHMQVCRLKELELLDCCTEVKGGCRRGQDGSDLLVIPIQTETLTQVLADIQDAA